MTKSITIQEGGTPKPMSDVAKIRTSLQGGGTCLWVPEDEVKLTTKHITENGTYKAEDDDKYGYSQVTVNVPGGAGGPAGGPGSSLVGTDTDGNDYLIGADENGDLEKTKLPSSITVATPPTKTQYVDGENVNISGIVVNASYGDGTAYESNPIAEGELSIDPTTADISKSVQSDEWDVSGTTLTAPVYMQMLGEDVIYMGHEGDISYYYVYDLVATAPVYAIRCPWHSLDSDSSLMGCFVSTEPFSCKTRRHAPSGWSPHLESITSHAVTVGDSTGYAGNEKYGSVGWNVLLSAYQGGTSIADTAVMAVTGGRPKSGTQEITVSWNRIGDGKKLDSTFDIQVTEGSESGGGGGFGGDGGGGAF